MRVTTAFAGLNANTSWYNLALGLVILIGRYPPITRARPICDEQARFDWIWCRDRHY